MKKILIIIFVILSISFGKIQNEEFKLEVTKVDTRNLENVVVTLKLKNNSSRTIEYLNMTCSYNIFFLTDNEEVVIIDKPCDKNIPVVLELESKSSVKMKINLKCKTLKKTNFKIGFKLTEMPKKIQMKNDKTATFKHITVWTEKIAL